MEDNICNSCGHPCHCDEVNCPECANDVCPECKCDKKELD